MRFRVFVSLAFLILATGVTSAETLPLMTEMVHLRGEFAGARGRDPEWATFPQGRGVPSGFGQSFEAKANPQEATLWVRQVDVKQTWNITLNGKKLRTLQKDEIDRRVAFAVPPGALKDGANAYEIRYGEQRQRGPDDIRVGEIAIDTRPLSQTLNEARLDITVIDRGTADPTPCRVTIVDEGGSMIQTGAVSDDRMAVRPGVIYSTDGRMDIGLPAGRYTVYAGRGFEYSLDQTTVDLAVGDKKNLRFNIEREVPTEGLVSCDPHIHTLTFAGHGDCTIAERMITIAGEHVELPISTEHNKHIDFETESRRMWWRHLFTPVIGNEVSSKVGHFNIFPILSGAVVPDHTPTHWSQLYEYMFSTPGVEVVSLNHGRDLHGNTPLGPEAFNDAIGENKDGWEFRINAMEVINSGATRTDPLQLYRDWFALMNRGVRVVGVGSSDSHYVANHFVGQGRTYIPADDSDPGNIDAHAAVRQIARGRAMVSYGLLTRWDLSKRSDGRIDANITVHGPSWVTADRLMIFMNGRMIVDRAIQLRPTQADAALGPRYPVTKFKETLVLDNPGYDAHLVAIATGPGEHAPYWPLAKPYQPSRPEWTPRVLGSSVAIRIDGDGDGQYTTAYRYARDTITEHHADLNALVEKLTRYDAAVAAQAAGILDKLGVKPDDPRLVEAFKAAGSGAGPVREGFEAYREAAGASR
ncbi:MAG: CehA/McbA family metallohydrolase [Planctomycetota bacterium]|jgi:hypothetical protein